MPSAPDIEPVKLPVYSKLAQIVIGILAFFYILYIGQDIIVPLVFATIFAILLNPAVNFLCNKGFNRALAVLLVLITAFIAVIALCYFLGAQMSMFSESFPQFKAKFLSMVHDLLQWVSKTFNISQSKINAWIEKMKSESMNNGTALVGQTMGTIGSVLAMVFLLPVYIFMILYYKPLLLDFIARLFDKKQHSIVAEVLLESKSLIQSYLVGLLAEAAIVATLNSAGLLILGVQYAILIGIVGALLNIIPYIGGVIAVAIPMIVALATKEPVYALWVLIVYLVVQFIDNNLIVPKIVGSKVKINALVSIIVVLVGGALWGFSGMFLSIPLTAIIKVVFDRIEPLKPFGFLLGDNQPEVGKVIFHFKKPSKKKVSVKKAE